MGEHDTDFDTDTRRENEFIRTPELSVSGCWYAIARTDCLNFFQIFHIYSALKNCLILTKIKEKLIANFIFFGWAMKQNLEDSTLSLDDVQRLLELEEVKGGSFAEILSLESLTTSEQRELLKIRRDFRRYWADGKVSEGLVKFLTLAPLMRLTGFYDAPLQISMEGSIPIEVEGEEKTIKGKLDILAVKNTEGETAANLWLLAIESKNSAIEPFVGLPQLLTYAFKSLEQQSLVWGLATNGVSYEFLVLRRGNPPTYQILPELNLIDSDRAIELGRVLKSICKLEAAQLRLV